MRGELVEVPERLETPRLVLRPYQAADAEGLWQAIEESRDYLRPWLRHWPSQPSLEAVRVEVAKLRAEWITRERLAFGIFERASERYLGEVVLFALEWDVPSAMMGYWIRRSAAGQGLMHEAVERVTRLVRQDLRCVRVEARVDTRNVRSEQVLQALGFTHEGTLKSCARDAFGELIDVHVYAAT